MAVVLRTSPAFERKVQTLRTSTRRFDLQPSSQPIQGVDDSFSNWFRAQSSKQTSTVADISFEKAFGNCC